ncbi:glycine betaine/proline transport system substrate-binding protein [Paenibacillus phyllosphaerae]|uniref:Glycine betaine/proline transport system substrate-binding protein n=1 Tax=Paenibacillus phyllosphaerae TaxID=274593 RepID=A0A7W5FN69_9BACL|nr:glycine betaine ABC transporter substrate-binding protein [Paenibacillus phyllosphaerae]MBB3110980.1 glycine betaine/proline transport system substrate-binding protein [Paenibacillus phyllosphaerae]
MKKKWGLALSAVIIAAGLAGCTNAGDNKAIKLAYVAWDSEIASTNVVKYVLESKLDYEVELLQVDAGPMWAGIADGSADAMVAAWLPSTHASYLEKYGADMEDLGENLSGTKVGLVVPSYMELSSIEDLKTAGSDVAHKIIGIEPGAGIMMSTDQALKDYGLDSDWKLVESSSAAMATELQKAYEAKEPIIVTGWTPHWMFAKMDLKYLEDPKGVYGGDEQIHTMARKDLQSDMPDAYKLLDQFTWTPDDMAEVMVAIQEGKSPEEAAKAWVDSHEDQVKAWLAGIE